MKLFIILIASGLLALLLTACSEEAQPYEEINASISISQDQGHIQTH